jgi:hypothetical protein
MKTRWKILIAVGIVMALSCAVSFVTMRIQPANEVEAYKKLLREKGEKLEISEVLPPPVAPASNCVSLVEAAFNLFVPGGEAYTNLPLTMQMIAPGKAMVGWAQPDLREMDSAGYTNSWDNALAQVEQNRPVIDSLTQAASFPALDFQLDYGKGFEMLLPHLAPLKCCAQQLSAAAMCALHQGDAAAATTNLCTLLSLVRADHDEPVLISQLVRIAMANIAVAANWELLQSTNLTDAELAALQKSWERQEFIAAIKGAFELERAMSDATIQKMRVSLADFNRMAGASGSGGSSSFGGWGSSGSWLEDAGDYIKDGLDGAKGRGAEYMWRESWSYSDQLRVLQAGQIVLEATRTIQTNQIFQPTLKNAIAKLGKFHASAAGSGWVADFNDWLAGDWREIFSGGMVANGTAIRKVLAAETSRRVVITAIALKRFRLQRGNFPEQLSELVPEFLAAVPLDAVDGNPLRYHRNAETFLLYSIGDDGVDDGGDTTPAKTTTSATWYWLRGRDWVWPQPATEAETKYFYEHPPN